MTNNQPQDSDSILISRGDLKRLTGQTDSTTSDYALIDRKILMELRRFMILVLKCLDTALGLPPTIPNRKQRRKRLEG